MTEESEITINLPEKPAAVSAEATQVTVRRPVSRRTFLKVAATAATAAALAGCLPGSPDTTTKATPVAKTPVPGAGPTPAPSVIDQIKGLAEKKIEDIKGIGDEGKIIGDITKKLEKAAEINKEQGALGDTEAPSKTRNDLATEYEKRFQDAKTPSNPWDFKRNDVAVLVALDGPGWWAAVPRVREYVEGLAGRTLTPVEIDTLQKDRTAAISFLQELYANGKISKEVLDFYSLPQAEAEAEVNKMFPNLLSSRK